MRAPLMEPLMRKSLNVCAGEIAEVKGAPILEPNEATTCCLIMPMRLLPRLPSITSVADLTICRRSPGTAAPDVSSIIATDNGSDPVSAMPAIVTGTASTPAFDFCNSDCDSSIESFAIQEGSPAHYTCIPWKEM